MEGQYDQDGPNNFKKPKLDNALVPTLPQRATTFEAEEGEVSPEELNANQGGLARFPLQKFRQQQPQHSKVPRGGSHFPGPIPQQQHSFLQNAPYPTMPHMYNPAMPAGYGREPLIQAPPHVQQSMPPPSFAMQQQPQYPFQGRGTVAMHGQQFQQQHLAQQQGAHLQQQQLYMQQQAERQRQEEARQEAIRVQQAERLRQEEAIRAQQQAERQRLEEAMRVQQEMEKRRLEMEREALQKQKQAQEQKEWENMMQQRALQQQAQQQNAALAMQQQQAQQQPLQQVQPVGILLQALALQQQAQLFSVTTKLQQCVQAGTITFQQALAQKEAVLDQHKLQIQNLVNILQVQQFQQLQALALQQQQQSAEAQAKAEAPQPEDRPALTRQESRSNSLESMLISMQRGQDGAEHDDSPKMDVEKYQPPVDMTKLSDQQLQTHLIYIIDFELILSVGTRVVPVEMAIDKFSIAEGEVSFHKFIDPGKIELCHASSVVHRQRIHGLSKQKFEFSESNYQHLVNDMCKFFDFRPRDFSKPRPSIYGKGAATLTACLEWIAEKAGLPENVFGPVQPFENLIAFTYARSNKPYTNDDLLNFFNPRISVRSAVLSPMCAGWDFKLTRCFHAKLAEEKRRITGPNLWTKFNSATSASSTVLNLSRHIVYAFLVSLMSSMLSE